MYIQHAAVLQGYNQILQVTYNKYLTYNTHNTYVQYLAVMQGYNQIP